MALTWWWPTRAAWLTTCAQHWRCRDGFQADFDAGRAGSEASNPYLRQSALAVEQAMLACL